MKKHKPQKEKTVVRPTTPELTDLYYRFDSWQRSLDCAIKEKSFFGKPRFSASDLLLIMGKVAEAKGAFWKKVRQEYPEDCDLYPKVSADYQNITFKNEKA